MPKQVDHDERQEAIACVTMELIADIGIERVTLRDVAKASGVSIGIIQHYFENKHALLLSTLNRVDHRYIDRLNTALQRNSYTGIEAVSVILEHSLPLTDEALLEWKIRLQILPLSTIEPELLVAGMERFEASRNQMLGALKLAHKNGTLNKQLSPLNAYKKIQAFTMGNSILAAMNHPNFSRKDLRSNTKQLIGEISN